MRVLKATSNTVFDAIRCKDLSFYDDAELCGQFAHFLSLQNLSDQRRARAEFLAAEREEAERIW